MLVLNVRGEVRAARESDARRLVDVFREAWQLAYHGVIPKCDLDYSVNRRGLAWWRRALRLRHDIIVVSSSGTVAGYAMFGKARGKFGDMGEITELYIAPEYHGLGLGELLFEGCRSRLDERGFNGLLVWSLSGNVSAIEFYRRRGGFISGQSWERVGSSTQPKVALVWD